MIKYFNWVLLLGLIVLGAGIEIKATSGQIRESSQVINGQLCVQTFICTPAGWVPFSNPEWFYITE